MPTPHHHIVGGKGTRRKRFVRVPGEPLPPFRYQKPRDDCTLDIVYRYGEIPSDWLKELASGSPQKTGRRLQKLYKHEYLNRKKQGNNAPITYVLDRRGYERLAEKHHTTPEQVRRKSHARFKQSIYHHAREITAFRYTLERTLPTRPDIHIAFWYADGTITETVSYRSLGQRITTSLKKDSFFGLHCSVPGRDPVLIGNVLEHDRATVSGTTKADSTHFRRYDAYWHMWQQGIFAHKYSTTILRILTVTTSDERKENLRALARQAGKQARGSQVFWFTCATHYADHPAAILDPIWQTPRDTTLHALLDFIPPAPYQHSRAVPRGLPEHQTRDTLPAY